MLSSLLSTGCLLLSAQVSPQAAPEFRALFDGASLAGWEGDPERWTVEEGAIVGRTTRENPLERSTYLVWRGGEVRDFELVLEYRLRAGNSGVQFRSREVGAHVVAGYQADLADEAGFSGALYEQFGRGFLARRGEEARFEAIGKGETRRFAEESALAAVVHAGDWNELRVRAVGEELELWVNGTKTCAVVDKNRQRASLSGLLALQLHSGEPMEVAFRKVALADLGGVHDDRVRRDPQWIWPKPDAADGEEAWFRKTFELGSVPAKALLVAAGDDILEVTLNGALVLESAGDGALSLLEIDVTPRLRPGTNVIAAWVRNASGAAALLLDLSAQGDGWRESISSDATWSAASREPPGWTELDTDAASWRPAHSFGPLGTEPWGVPARRAVGPPPEPLAGNQVRLPDGFSAELVYAVPRASRGSWVSLCFDDRGRAIASDQEGALVRIDLSTPGAHRAERLDVELHAAQGLLHAFGALYAVVNDAETGASGLYRARDPDGDGRFEPPELLQAFDGSGEHGPHGIVAGPDGRSLYVLGGDSVRPPPAARAAWGPSILPAGMLPPLVLSGGIYVSEMIAEGGAGWVCRTDPDGKRWELFGYGIRNAYDGAFDAEGELFVFDSDMEWYQGLPWYLPTRLLHVTSGADFGHRPGTGRWPPYLPDTLPAAAEVGRSSPTGMVSGARTSFPGAWKSALFAGDWLWGRILAFRPRAAGASFTADWEVFASGEPLPVTDLAVGPDGALYFTTGGRGVRSGLYRIVYDGADGTASEDPHADGGLAEQRSQRELRRSLEAFHAAPDERTVAVAWPYLDDPDRHVRYAARVAIERRAFEEWEPALARETRPRARLEALLAAARVAPGASLGALLGRLRELDLGALSSEERLVWLRCAALAVLRGTDLPQEELDALGRTLLPLFPTGVTSVDRELGVLLAQLEVEGFLQQALARLGSTDPADAFYYGFVVRRWSRGWSETERRSYLDWLNANTRAFEGARSAQLFLQGIRRDFLSSASVEERRVLKPYLALRAPRPAFPIVQRGFVRAWTAEEFDLSWSAVREAGRAAEGKSVFRESCNACHRLGSDGADRGPELEGVAGRFMPRDLIESILEPSRFVPDRFRETEVWTKDDRVRVGELVGSDDDALVLRSGAQLQEVVRIPRDEVAEVRAHPLSPMPQGLLDVYERQAIVDLLAYLQSEGAPPGQ